MLRKIKRLYMNRIFPAITGLLLFSSCGPMVSYVGSSYAPTEQVDVYVDASAIKKNYTIVGRGHLNVPVGATFYNNYEKLQKQAVARARKHGANAVLFLDRIFIATQTGVNSTYQYDTAGRRTHSSTIIGPVTHSQLEIHFLRYE